MWNSDKLWTVDTKFSQVLLPSLALTFISSNVAFFKCDPAAFSCFFQIFSFLPQILLVIENETSFSTNRHENWNVLAVYLEKLWTLLVIKIRDEKMLTFFRSERRFAEALFVVFKLDSKGTSLFARPRYVAAVCPPLRWYSVLRPDDASKKRFSWFPDWIPKAQRNVNLKYLIKSLTTSICLQKSVAIQPRTSPPKFAKRQLDSWTDWVRTNVGFSLFTIFLKRAEK